MLTAIKKAGYSKDNRVVWIFECDCGGKLECSSKEIVNGKIKSCGCLHYKFPRDITGITFNKLLVLSKSDFKTKKGSYWNCICVCGNHITVSRDSLTSGNTKSCGCIMGSTLVENISGQRFGRLLVLGYTTRASDGKLIWRCLCDCGNVTNVAKSALTSGCTQSCGCYAIEKSTENLLKYVRAAIGEKHYAWNPDLTEEEREIGRLFNSYPKWRDEVYSRDNYSCITCGKNKGFNAHHIYGYTEYKNIRVCVNNGITLCVDCHNEYHTLFGKKHSTLDKFIKFLYIKGERESPPIEVISKIKKVDMLIEKENVKEFNKVLNYQFDEIYQLVKEVQNDIFK